MLKKILKFVVITIFVLGVATFLFMLQPSFGKLPKDARLERVAQSPNYRDNRFQNRIETPALAEGVSYFGVIIDFFGKGVNREPADTIPSLKPDLQADMGEKPAIIWFGHSSVLIKVNGKNILVDPVFSERASPVQYAGSKSYPGTMIYTADDFPEIDMLVISHDHYDHLDYHTIVSFKEKAKLFCVPLGVSEHLLHWGIDPNKIQEFDWWDSKQVLPGIELIATPARHFSGRGFTRDKTLWASYVLKTDSHKIFIGGDSGYDDVFKVIGEKYGPFDIAMLECGQYDPQWPYIHMMPEETVQASVDLQAKVLMPIHWGKFTLALHPWNDPIKRASIHAATLDVIITTPIIGEPVVLHDMIPKTEWWK
jgi:L-ascorbate metabolism protein UlaG (beta-lactamase superfamily)